MPKEIKDFYKSYSKDKQELIDNCNDLFSEGYELLSYYTEQNENEVWYIATFVLYNNKLNK